MARRRSAVGFTAARKIAHEAEPEGSWWRGLLAAADGACAINCEGRITLWNQAATRIMGYEAHEVVGQHCCDVFVSNNAPRHRGCGGSCRLLAQIKNGEAAETSDLLTTAKGGHPIWVNMSTIILPPAGTTAPRVIRMFRDVTALKNLLSLIRQRYAVSPAADDPVGRLTKREGEILRLMASGATNRALAARLHVSTATIRNHTHNIFSKLNVPNRLAAVVLAFGLLV